MQWAESLSAGAWHQLLRLIYAWCAGEEQLLRVLQCAQRHCDGGPLRSGHRAEIAEAALSRYGSECQGEQVF